MANALKQKYAGSCVEGIDFLENIFVSEFHTVQKLETFLFSTLPELLKAHPEVKLLVIDSIAGIFRVETNFIEGAKTFRKVASELERWAAKFNFAIFTTNHLISVPPVGNEGPKEITSLGPTWDSMVSTKLKVSNTSRYRSSRVRTMQLEFAE
jgi:hypothetical protein